MHTDDLFNRSDDHQLFMIGIESKKKMGDGRRVKKKYKKMGEWREYGIPEDTKGRNGVGGIKKKVV